MYKFSGMLGYCFHVAPKRLGDTLNTHALVARDQSYDVNAAMICNTFKVAFQLFRRLNLLGHIIIIEKAL